MLLLKIIREGKTETVINVKEIDNIYTDEENTVHLTTLKNSYYLKGVNIDDLVTLIIKMTAQSERYGNSVVEELSVE